MWFPADLHRGISSAPRSRLAGSMSAVVLVIATLTSPAQVQAQEMLVQPLPPMLPVTASAALSPDLLLITSVDVASQSSPDESAQAADGNSVGTVILGGIGGVLALGLTLLAGVNSRKRWPNLATLKNA